MPEPEVFPPGGLPASCARCVLLRSSCLVELGRAEARGDACGDECETPADVEPPRLGEVAFDEDLLVEDDLGDDERGEGDGECDLELDDERGISYVPRCTAIESRTTV